MSMCVFNKTNRAARRLGLSLIEVIASTMIVGLMTVVALDGLGAATRSSESIGNRAVAIGLADELMAEILQQNYSEPTQTAVFGRESGELATNRSTFDDVDDYHNYNQSPPRYRDGTVMPNRANWRHQVQISRVSPNNPLQMVGTDQGVKLITIIVSFNGQILAQQSAIRTDTDEK